MGKKDFGRAQVGSRVSKKNFLSRGLFSGTTQFVFGCRQEWMRLKLLDTA
jgi:hypothetical protein